MGIESISDKAAHYLAKFEGPPQYDSPDLILESLKQISKRGLEEFVNMPCGGERVQLHFSKKIEKQLRRVERGLEPIPE